MLTRLANLGIRAPRRVLVAAGFLLILAVIFGAPVASHLSAGGFRDPHSASSKADDLLQKTFNAGDANLILEVTSPDGADSAAARAEGGSQGSPASVPERTKTVRPFQVLAAPSSQRRVDARGTGAE